MVGTGCSGHHGTVEQHTPESAPDWESLGRQNTVTMEYKPRVSPASGRRLRTLMACLTLSALLCEAAVGQQFFEYDQPDVTINSQALGDTESYEPSVVIRSDGTWVTWLQFVAGQGDHIWIGRLEPTGWAFKLPVTPTAGTYATPTLTIDAAEGLWLSYEEWDPVLQRWDIQLRYHESVNIFQTSVRVNTGDHNAINHSVASDPDGGLWFAWQEDLPIAGPTPRSPFLLNGGWVPGPEDPGRQFDVVVRWMSSGSGHGAVRRLSRSWWGDWRPAITVTSGGSVCVAWDRYDGESYDVVARWRVNDQWLPRVVVAEGPAFQGFVSLATADPDSAWCVWEEGGENWGKDYFGIAGDWNNITDHYGPVHRFRTLSVVKLVDDGQILATDPLPMPMIPVASSRPNIRPGVTLTGLYYERGELVVDGSGAPWVFYRHFYAPQIGLNEPVEHHEEEGWVVYGRQLTGTGWSQLYAFDILQRDGMQRLGLAGTSDGVVAAWTTGRTDRGSPSSARGVYLAEVSTRGAFRGGGGPLDAGPPKLHPVRPRGDQDGRPRPSDSGPASRELDGYQLFFGDLHRHTDLSLCFPFFDGSLEDNYRASIDAVGLDFLGVTDHSRDLDLGDALSQVWWRTVKAATRHRLAGTFFTYYSYERSSGNTDHNVISLRDDMLRSHTPPLTSFWALIDQDTFTIPHRTSNSGGGFTGDVWNYQDDEKRPLLEIYQACRDLDAQVAAHNGLNHGYHLGFIASSDHLSNHCSFACVWSPSADREAIFRAMQARRTYGATDKIAVAFRAGDAWMGERISASGQVELDLRIIGTGPIDHVHLYADGSILHTIPGGHQRTLDTYYQVTVPSDGAEHYYYILMEQADGHQAWSSPIWITDDGPGAGDLVDHYRFENDGTDSQGGDADGIVGANVTFTTGVVGQAAVFGVGAVGSDRRIDVPQAVAFAPGTSDFSFAFWVRRDQADTNTADGVFDPLAGGGIGYQAFFGTGDTANRIRFQLEDDSGAGVLVLAQTPVADTTEFHHIALTVDRAAGEAVVYVDGVAEPPIDISALTGGIFPDQDLQIGGLDDDPTYGLDGLIDELRFYDLALDASDVANLAEGPGAPVDWYELENNGLDSAGGDANGTLGGNVTFAAGEIGQAAVFGVSAAGSANLIEVPHSNAFDPGQEDFTIAFWVKRDQADTTDADGVFDALASTGVGYQCNFRDGIDPNIIAFRLDDSGGSYVLIKAQNPMPDTTEFHHYALTVDRGNDQAVIYVDGVADPPVDISTLSGSISPDQKLQIGGLNDNSNNGLDGRLDDLRFYDRKLEESEVQALAF